MFLELESRTQKFLNIGNQNKKSTSLSRNCRKVKNFNDKFSFMTIKKIQTNNNVSTKNINENNCGVNVKKLIKIFEKKNISNK